MVYLTLACVIFNVYAIITAHENRQTFWLVVNIVLLVINSASLIGMTR